MNLTRFSVVEQRVTAPLLERPAAVSVPDGIETEEEDQALRQCNEWVMNQGLPEGEMMYELADPVSGEAVAILDLAWPNGLQEGLSQPVAVLIDEPTEVEEAVNHAGFQFFTDIDSFHEYVNREILALSPA